MKNILVLVFILFSVVSMAVGPKIPSAQGGVNTHQNIRRNLFDAPRQNPERLAALIYENRQKEAESAQRILDIVNDPTMNWTQIGGEMPLDVALAPLRQCIADADSKRTEKARIEELTDFFARGNLPLGMAIPTSLKELEELYSGRMCPNADNPDTEIDDGSDADDGDNFFESLPAAPSSQLP